MVIHFRAVEDDVIQRWYKEGMMHPSVLFSMKYGDWKAFHSQGEYKDCSTTAFVLTLTIGINVHV